MFLLVFKYITILYNHEPSLNDHRNYSAIIYDVSYEFNGNFRILKWRYMIMFGHILWGDSL